MFTTDKRFSRDPIEYMNKVHNLVADIAYFIQAGNLFKAFGLLMELYVLNKSMVIYPPESKEAKWQGQSLSCGLLARKDKIMELIDRLTIESSQAIEVADFIAHRIDYSKCGTQIEKMLKLTADFESVGYRAISLGRRQECEDAFLAYMRSFWRCWGSNPPPWTYMLVSKYGKWRIRLQAGLDKL